MDDRHSTKVRPQWRLNTHRHESAVVGLIAFIVLGACTNTPSESPADAGTEGLVEAIVYTTTRPPNFDIYLFDEPDQSPRRLTDDPAMDYNAVFSPDGRWVVFTSERGGNADLYALDLERDEAPVRLTRHIAMDDAAAFSADGRQLAFVSTRDGNADIFVMLFLPVDATGEDEAVNLTRRPGGDFNPAFSPDGAQIAYSRVDEFDGLGSTLIYVMSADGSDVRRISAPIPSAEDAAREHWHGSGSPTWSRDGSALYYYRINNDGSAIRRVALDGSGDTQITAPGLYPAIARDGRLAFTQPQPREGLDAEDTFSRTGRIFSVAADGSSLRPESDAARSYFAPDFDRGSTRMVSHGPGPVEGRSEVAEQQAYAYAFAPPDARLQAELPDRVLEVIGIRGYFPAVMPTGEIVSTVLRDGGPGPLTVTAIDGSNPRVLLDPQGSFAWGASVARQSGHVVVAVGPPQAPGEASVDIWKLLLDGSEAINLTADFAGNNALPHISADGSRIVFRRGGAAGGSIYAMDGEGGKLRRLGDDSAIETMPALSPDGEWVVFSTTAVEERKLWIQRVDGSEGRLLEPDRADIVDKSMHARFSPDGQWVVFTSDRSGFNDEWPTGWYPQPYGELWAVPAAGGPAVRLTHNKWEDGPSDWGSVRLPVSWR